ncbi:NADP-dependent oxidoreductase [Gordonia sputi]
MTATSPSDTMWAITQTTLGEPDVLTPTQVPRPTPPPGHILIRVHATSLNPTDWVHRRYPGFLGPINPADPPRILGWDVSGTIEQIGLGVTIHQPGEPVVAVLPYPASHGSAAEYVIAPARAAVPKPAGVTHTQAAAAALAGLTAHQAVVDCGQVTEGMRVLIHGAAGGVGHLAVQIARARGATVIATAASKHTPLLTRLGVEGHIDYQQTRFEDHATHIDVVIDCVGGDYPQRSLPTLRDKRGTIVSLVLNTTEPLNVPDVTHLLPLVEPDPHALTQVLAMIDRRQLTPTITQIYPLHQAAQAHQHGETGHLEGKLVLTSEGTTR